MGFQRVAVIGSGVMGSGIAAHCANAGMDVVLLDIVPDAAEDRDVVAAGALSKMLRTDSKSQIQSFMHPSFAERVRVGNLEDDLNLLADADWIVEVVIERLDIKHSIYSKIEEHRRPGSLVSSNTSTIPRSKLIEGMSESFASDFIITHFFNPPRYLPLLEVVAGDEVDARLLDDFCEFADIRLGKGVIRCNDTPGFIANRIGIYLMKRAVDAAFTHGLTVEQVDAMMSRPVGFPKTGIFGLLDLVGLDLMPYVVGSLAENLPDGDPMLEIAETHMDVFQRMIDEGYTGRKGKGGFYRLNTEGGGRVKEALNLVTGEYAPADRKAGFPSARRGRSGLLAVVESDDAGGRYVRDVMLHSLAYAASLIGVVSDDIDDIDSAMRMGFSWKRGPFELIDDLGVDWLVSALEDAEIEVPSYLMLAEGKSLYTTVDGTRSRLGLDGEHVDIPVLPEFLCVADLRRKGRALKRNASCSLWDMGDGVLLVEYTSKMNAVDPLIMEMIGKAVEMTETDGFKGIVIGNDGKNFCVGANLGLALLAANLGAWKEGEQFQRGGQNAYMALKYCSVPVVAAPTGFCFGGGCEVLMHCDAVQAHAESYIGLVEVGVGIIPSWGGCKELLGRLAERDGAMNGPMPAVMAAFETIGTAQVGKSAAQARGLGFLSDADEVTMRRERLLADAKARCIGLMDGYEPPSPRTYVLPGPSGRAALEMALADLHASGKATDHDVVVARELAYILTGGDTDLLGSVDEYELLEMETAANMRLIRTTPTLDRMQHMLETGRPLRN